MAINHLNMQENPIFDHDLGLDIWPLPLTIKLIWAYLSRKSLLNNIKRKPKKHNLKFIIVRQMVINHLNMQENPIFDHHLGLDILPLPLTIKLIWAYLSHKSLLNNIKRKPKKHNLKFIILRRMVINHLNMQENPIFDHYLGQAIWPPPPTV